MTGTVTAVDADGVTVSYTLSDDTPVQVGGWVFFLGGGQQLLLLWLCICWLFLGGRGRGKGEGHTQCDSVVASTCRVVEWHVRVCGQHVVQLGRQRARQARTCVCAGESLGLLLCAAAACRRV